MQKLTYFLRIFRFVEKKGSLCYAETIEEWFDFLKWGVPMKVAADFRREAREALRGKWKMAVLAALVATLLGATGNGFEMKFEKTAASANVGLEFSGMRLYSAGISGADHPGMQSFLAGTVTYLVVIAIILAVAQFIIGSVVSIGYAKYHMDLMDGEEGKINTLFDYFPQWKTMVVAGFLQMLYILLWGLLFIIPGVVAAYRYAMTPYILAENPEMRAGEAIDRSKELMDGNKWRLFCLGFSFIGWSILANLVPVIGNLLLLPYTNTANAAFYRDITRYSGYYQGAEDGQGTILIE